MMDRGTVRNMQSFIPKINLRNQCIYIYIYIYIYMRNQCICVCVYIYIYIYIYISLGRSVYELGNGLLRNTHEPKITGEKMTKFQRIRNADVTKENCDLERHRKFRHSPMHNKGKVLQSEGFQFCSLQIFRIQSQGAVTSLHINHYG